MNEIVIYYSKFYRFWWSIILASIVMIYLFIFLELQVFLFFHIISVICYSLVVWSTYRPYLKIKDGKIWTTRNLFNYLKEKDLKEVILVDERYIFKSKSGRFFVGIHFIEEEDNRKLKKYLMEKELLIEPISF